MEPLAGANEQRKVVLIQDEEAALRARKEGNARLQQ